MTLSEGEAQAYLDNFTKVRGFGPHETDSIYVEGEDRFIVSLIVGYSDEDLEGTPERKQRAKAAAAAALDLTRDRASDGTVWFVYDRKTGTMHKFEQSVFEGMEVP